eukprot:TRINITY_DN10440_c0_g2_i1.p3 TRINITY_DN10440_c0_g2~~TRINITY_DN10440_c0_g2_i1.p3  ORF type:complete len:157 (-),score=11.58 TRINITY_DN10440_c0_g2_i1:1179-1583(-)
MSGVLEKERQDLLTAIDHLQQTNQELQQTIQEVGPNPEYREIIGENIVAIAKKRSRIEYIEKELGIQVGNSKEQQIGSNQQSQQQYTIHTSGSVNEVQNEDNSCNNSIPQSQTIQSQNQNQQNQQNIQEEGVWL